MTITDTRQSTVSMHMTTASDNQETTAITVSGTRQSTVSMHSITNTRQPGNDSNQWQRHPTINTQHVPLSTIPGRGT